MPLITHTFDFDGGRQVSVYLPDAPVEAIAFAGDGQLIAPWGADLAGGPAAMIGGAYRLADERLRLHERAGQVRGGRASP
jgi:hypothetical protein